ncbi:MAG: SDR family oxidoreductase [Burkholderiales bacterium]|nr:3-phenylpropionate-dihydrodiol/cinnamic acid-dihydrodiol dehydrogenase [Rhodocyclaceae bacterium]MCZ2419846.1 SDR family oxidoreductase [Burkholderiales bacterium]
MTTIRGSRVLITGAANGIGRLMALRIAQKGGRVVLWDVDEAHLVAVAAEIAAAGGQATVVACNLAERESIEDAAARTLAEHGAVDVLINNAGIVDGKRLLEVSDAEVERTFAVNTLALFRTVRAFLPGMLAQGRGHIVTVASAAGIAAVPRMTDYSASKSAAIAFDEALRLELKHDGAPVKTTVVCPYYISTGMFEGVRTRFPLLLPIMKPEAVAARIVRAIERDESRVILPWFVRCAFPLRLLPTSWFDAIMDFFGITKSMDAFTGRKK